MSFCALHVAAMEDSPPALERISISEFVAQLMQLSCEDREELEQ